MTTPSNPSGIPSLPVVGLLAVILFLGLALAPRAFEFRAWPEPSRQYAVEQVVDRPLPPVTEVEVAGVRARDSRSLRDGAKVADRRDTADARRGERSGPGAKSRGGSVAPPRGGSGSAPAAPVTEEPEIVVEAPGPAPDQPSTPAPEQPAQLAEGEPGPQVMRPEPVAELDPEDLPLRSFGDGGELDVEGEDAGDDERGQRRHRGQGRGQRGHHGRGRGHQRHGD